MALFVDLVVLSNGLHGSVQMDSVAPPPWNTHTRTCFMYVYLYIDVAFVLMALVELLKIALIIIEKCKRH